MKERKYVKLRTDMYEDTKFKIIDKKPERDTIHYIWTRLLALAAKVNLFMSRNIPYTVEILAIEFNRSEEQIKLAIDVFLELEMLELIDSRIYRIKNFAKKINSKVVILAAGGYARNFMDTIKIHYHTAQVFARK